MSTANANAHIFVYGPPGSGKTTLGGRLSQALDLPFIDLDAEIERRAGMTIAEIFGAEGEDSFRSREQQALGEAVGGAASVIALGGGALVNPQSRAFAEEHGQVLCLDASLEKLLERLRSESATRPLLADGLEDRLRQLLQRRAQHYQSFPRRLDTFSQDLDELTWQAQLALGAFRVRGMGQPYDVRIVPGGLDRLGAFLQERGLKGPVALVSDQNIGSIYQERVLNALEKAGYASSMLCIEPGETHKTIETILQMWNFFIDAGIDRGSTVVALGGGVVGDMTGFAASTFLRGVAWVNVPTSLLAMVDASMGGKTGFDLPQAKNMVGLFSSPRLVLSDPQVLDSLPEGELRSGMAEVVKHGIIADAQLYELCGQGWETVKASLDAIVRRAMAVKLKVIEVDPYEKGLRQALNLGHTVGHGVEITSNFRLSHGESVAIGTVAEAQLAEQIGLAQPGLSENIAAVLSSLGLPVAIPADLSRERVAQAMQLDKKRAAGKVHFALPLRIGEVQTGVIIDDWQKRIAG